MNQRTRNIILLLIGLQVLVIIGLLVLTPIAEAIPGRYRVALQQRSPFLSNIAEGIIGRVAPAPTALPAPSQPRSVARAEVDVARLLNATATAEPATPPTVTSTATPTIAVVTTTTPTGEPTATATATPQPLPERVKLEGVGAIAQTFNNCGPANLTQVLNYYDLDITQTDVAERLKPNPEDRNVSPWQIADYVNEQTSLHASVHSNGTVALIKELVAAGYPVVVEKGYEPGTSNAPGWWGHYLTIFGYDDTEQMFYGQDSFLGPFDGSGRTDSYEDVERFWQQFNYTFYVVHRPEQEAAVQAILGPDLLDEEQMWRGAAARADAETKTDPNNVFAWFNLGTSLTRLGEMTGESQFYEAGAQAFDQARTMGLPPRMLWYQFRIYTAYQKVGRFQDVIDLANTVLAEQGGRNVEETHWYKGHALLALGDVAGARQAYEEALRVNQNFYPAQWSLDYVDSLGG